MAALNDTVFVSTTPGAGNGEQEIPLTFSYLSAFAQFLLNNSTQAMAASQLQLVRQLDVPILRYFSSMPEKEILERSEARMKVLLQSLIDNRAAEYIDETLQAWKEDQLPLLSRDKILPEDITLISFIRRKVFRNFLPQYTTDTELFIKILEEIDIFTTETDTRSFKILMSIQQELYRQTQQLAQIGNWMWDLVRDKITWSDEIFRIYELAPQHEITYNLAALNHPEDAAMVLEQMARSKQTLQPHDFYYRIVLPGNQIKMLHAKGHVLTGNDGKAYRMFGTLQDVTAQKQLENEVLEKQTIIQKIADLTPSMIAAYNINTGKYLFINRALHSILGYSQEEALEKGVAFFTSLVHPDDLQPLMEKNTSALIKANAIHEEGKEDIVEFLYRLRHADGEYRWMQTYGTIFNRNKKGEVEEVINISIDVTGQVTIANELKAKHEELEQKNKELESFTYIASHDLQEPLRKIKFFTNQIKPKENTDGGADYHNRISNEATRMQLMINGLLEYSQMGRDEKVMRPLDLNTVLDDVKKDLHDMLDKNNVTIDAGTLPTINGLELQMHQLFVNLITNAVKYSRHDLPPHITIMAELLADPTILSNTASVFKITFQDNGIGFEEKYAGHIFELFRRLHSKTAYPGTGVGLTICKRIVENHNGIIRAKGIPNQGAAFIIYLPAGE